MDIKNFFAKHHKKLLVIHILIVLFALLYNIGFYYQNGDIMYRDVSLKGGISATVETENSFDILDLENKLTNTLSDVSVRKLSEFGTEKQIGVIIETASTDDEALKKELESFFGFPLNKDNYSVELTGSTLGSSFYKQMLRALIVAFIFMGIVVFAVYRAFTPSIAVIQAALSDIIIALALSNIFQIKFSTAGIAGLLLLIGYSVDTDILLTTRTLKRPSADVLDRMYEAAKTGMTMTITTLAALTVGFFVSNSGVIKVMFLIIIFGLIADLIATYFGNASLLYMYVKKKKNEN